MPVSPSSAPPRHSANARLLGDVRGATAIEFGLVALPFLALLGAIVQLAFTIWAAQNFDFVFQKAVRSLFTGQFQQNNDQTAQASVVLAALQSKMCGSGSATTMTIFNCSAVKIDITTGKSFASSAAASPLDATTKNWSSSFGTHYACASPGTIVVATAAVKFPVFFGLWDAGLSNFADGSKLLVSTAVFRTEPYAAAANSPC